MIDCLLELPRGEPAGTGAAAVDDDSRLVHEVQTLGPSGVGRHHRVVDLIYIGVDSVLQCDLALSGDGASLLHRIGVADSVFAADVPAVDGVGLADVYDEKLDAVAIGLVEIPEVHGLPHEGWSGEAAKYQGHRLSSAKARQPYGALPRRILQLEVWCRVPHARRQRLVAPLPGVGGLSTVDRAVHESNVSGFVVFFLFRCGYFTLLFGLFLLVLVLIFSALVAHIELLSSFLWTSAIYPNVTEVLANCCVYFPGGVTQVGSPTRLAERNNQWK